MYDDRGTPTIIPESKRPFLISFLCFMMITIIVVSLFIVFFEPKLKELIFIIYSKTTIFLLIAFDITTIIALIGIWRMKSWGIFLYIVVFLLSSYYAELIGAINYWQYILGTILLLACLLYRKKFTM